MYIVHVEGFVCGCRLSNVFLCRPEHRETYYVMYILKLTAVGSSKRRIKSEVTKAISETGLKTFKMNDLI